MKITREGVFMELLNPKNIDKNVEETVDAIFDAIESDSDKIFKEE